MNPELEAFLREAVERFGVDRRLSLITEWGSPFLSGGARRARPEQDALVEYMQRRGVESVSEAMVVMQSLFGFTPTELLPLADEAGFRAEWDEAFGSRMAVHPALGVSAEVETARFLSNDGVTINLGAGAAQGLLRDNADGSRKTGVLVLNLSIDQLVAMGLGDIIGQPVDVTMDATTDRQVRLAGTHQKVIVVPSDYVTDPDTYGPAMALILGSAGIIDVPEGAITQNPGEPPTWTDPGSEETQETVAGMGDLTDIESILESLPDTPGGERASGESRTTRGGFTAFPVDSTEWLDYLGFEGTLINGVLVPAPRGGAFRTGPTGRGPVAPTLAGAALSSNEDAVAAARAGTPTATVTEPGAYGTATELFVEARFRPGDERLFFSNWPEERIADIQNRMVEAGLLQAGDFRLGYWDQMSQQAMQQVMAYSNRYGLHAQEDIGQPYMRGDLGGILWALDLIAAERPDLPEYVPPRPRTPDQATLRSIIREEYRSRLGRDPHASEMASFTQYLSEQYRLAMNQEALSAERDWVAQMAQQQGPTGQFYRLSPEDQALMSDTSPIESIDPISRFEEMFDTRMAPSLEMVSRRGKRNDLRESLLGSIMAGRSLGS